MVLALGGGHAVVLLLLLLLLLLAPPPAEPLPRAGTVQPNARCGGGALDRLEEGLVDAAASVGGELHEGALAWVGDPSATFCCL